MKLAIISASKLKDSNILKLESEYLKRLRNFEVIELSGSKKSAEQEGQALLKAAAKFDRIIALDEKGKHLSSKQFSEQLNSWRLKGSGSFAFIIGSAYGLSKEVIENSDFVWSLSALTFPFQLARLLAVEQLYRASCILSGHPYHKD